MLGIDYTSSGEEDETASTPIPMAIPKLPKPHTVEPAALVPTTPTAATKDAMRTVSAVPAGPMQGPTARPPSEYDPPGSPYTVNRLTVQNLTLPPVPNFDIPSSPLGSPPRSSTQKFAQFLELKKKGQHFNQRLENSNALRDPSHMKKLMEFAGISDEDQYASALPEGLEIPTIWPEWAYGDALNAAQKRVNSAKESARSKTPRSVVDFVPARSSELAGTDSLAKESTQSVAERLTAESH